MATPLAAEGPEPPKPDLSPGESVEVEVRADLNADGMADLAYIAVKEDSRELRVVTTYRDQFAIGENVPEVLKLDPYPLGDAELSVKRNVLVFGELTGGTTAVASTQKFHWDPKLGAMRLIGLDATLYSRTLAHDGAEASWNLLTGDLVTRQLKLNKGAGDAAYTRIAEKKTKKPSPPIRLEKSPDGGDLLGWPGAK
ncbi:MAG: hypothetical protein ACKO01_00560 [Erythrobacter sp.]